jgi:hypothetical protein
MCFSPKSGATSWGGGGGVNVASICVFELRTAGQKSVGIREVLRPATWIKFVFSWYPNPALKILV